MKLTLKSNAFTHEQPIPTRYTGEGADISPQLAWSHIPEGTREFALICEDPDAPTAEPWVHWLIYNISPNVTFLPEGLPAHERIEAPIPADQGHNSFGNIGYGGPMPPQGDGAHRYLFRIYALDSELGIAPGMSGEEFKKAIHGHVLADAVLMGTYLRSLKREQVA